MGTGQKDCVLLVGLGNPGAVHVHSRHNVGQFVLDVLARHLNLKWVNNRRLNADLARGHCDGGDFLLARPLAFMNASGYPVLRIVHYFHIAAENAVIVYDDLNLPLGSYKVTHRVGSGGHLGMADVSEKLGECTRFRIGIGPKRDPEMDLKDYVLDRFSDEEQAALFYAMPTILEGLQEICLSGKTLA
ncbi:MAG: aminoacyl-tRNA hydrolase [Puniceicoccales bacterium]|jgi:PTH1 family peptidyl-tRNA hydrolase|nr:aminoacyl-tRNA hydrolase [Puniceicoccales bacterium]